MSDSEVAVILSRLETLTEAVREAAAARERAESRMWERLDAIDKRITTGEIAAAQLAVRVGSSSKRGETVFAAVVSALAASALTVVAALVLRGMQA